MNFFCTKKHYEKWLASETISKPHYCLTAQEALHVAKMLFGR
ncbi:MAG: alkylmercury lyase family protein [Desulfobulbaceae bacterium]|nr:alkylmercury lyase family protein [Desulfobulbaceae bacterium]